ncbi:MAG: LamG domain-containing protein [Bacillota bacterium]|nr:LamG domain-containing protein [Bacillota bacterium]
MAAITITRNIALATSTPPTFSRPSVAYLTSGQQVAAGQPRFETIAGRMGLWVEERTTNEVANPSFEIDLTGWRARFNSGTLSRLSAGGFVGSSFMRWVAADTSDFRGPLTSAYFTVNPNETITVSAWVKGSGKGTLAILDATGQVVGGDGGGWLSSLGALDIPSAWTRWALTWTNNTGLVKYVYIHISQWVTPSPATIDVDGVQFERKGYATTYVDTSRAAETLTIPTAGVLNPQQGTIELSLQMLNLHNWNDILTGALNSGRFDFFTDASGAVHWDFGLSNSGPISASGVLSVGPWYVVALVWSAPSLTVYVNGSQVATNNSYDPSVGLPTNFGLNTGWDGDADCNIDFLRISSRARTASEIAAVASAYLNNGTPPVDADTTYYLGFDGAITLGGGVRFLPPA